jgi:hypothetical protein
VTVTLPTPPRPARCGPLLLLGASACWAPGREHTPEELLSGQVRSVVFEVDAIGEAALPPAAFFTDPQFGHTWPYGRELIRWIVGPDAEIRFPESVDDIEVVSVPGDDGRLLSDRMMQDTLDRHRDTVSTRREATFYVLLSDRPFDGYAADSTANGVADEPQHRMTFIMRDEEGEPAYPALSDAHLGWGVAHELAHMMGLVNRGTPMVEPHQSASDPDHGTEPGGCILNDVETMPVWGFGPGTTAPSHEVLGPLCRQDIDALRSE